LSEQSLYARQSIDCFGHLRGRSRCSRTHVLLEQGCLSLDLTLQLVGVVQGNLTQSGNAPSPGVACPKRSATAMKELYWRRK